MNRFWLVVIFLAVWPHYFIQLCSGDCSQGSAFVSILGVTSFGGMPLPASFFLIKFILALFCVEILIRFQRAASEPTSIFFRYSTNATSISLLFLCITTVCFSLYMQHVAHRIDEQGRAVLAESLNARTRQEVTAFLENNSVPYDKLNVDLILDTRGQNFACLYDCIVTVSHGLYPDGEYCFQNDQVIHTNRNPISDARIAILPNCYGGGQNCKYGGGKDTERACKL